MAADHSDLARLLGLEDVPLPPDTPSQLATCTLLGIAVQRLQRRLKETERQLSLASDRLAAIEAVMPDEWRESRGLP